MSIAKEEILLPVRDKYRIVIPLKRVEASASGLESRVATHDEVLAALDPQKFDLNEKEPFLRFERRDPPGV